MLPIPNTPNRQNPNPGRDELEGTGFASRRYLSNDPGSRVMDSEVFMSFEPLTWILGTIKAPFAKTKCKVQFSGSLFFPEWLQGSRGSYPSNL